VAQAAPGFAANDFLGEFSGTLQKSGISGTFLRLYGPSKYIAFYGK
jgi:hypothetical protein